MSSANQFLLQQADRAMARRDYLNVIRYALGASAAQEEQSETRCDAYLMLAQASLALELPDHALSYAVGAHLAARWANDAVREGKASSLVRMAKARLPEMSQVTILGPSH